MFYYKLFAVRPVLKRFLAVMFVYKQFLTQLSFKTSPAEGCFLRFVVYVQLHEIAP